MLYGLHVLDTEDGSRICLLFKVLVMQHDAKIKNFMCIVWYGLEAPYSSDYSCLCVAEMKKKNEWKWMRVPISSAVYKYLKEEAQSYFFFLNEPDSDDDCCKTNILPKFYHFT